MLLIVAATTVTIISCKKQDVQIDAFTKITDVSSKIAKEWLISQKSSAKAKDQLAIDSIMNVMNWTNGKSTDIGKNQSLLYIPLFTKNNNIGISLYFNETSQKIDSAYLYLLDTKEAFGDIGAANILLSYLTKAKFSFTGSITSYTVFNKYKMGQGYENGILKYTKIEKNKAKGASNEQIQTNGVRCWNRFLVTTYGDGSEREQFLFTWCEGYDDCQTTGTVRLSDGQQEIKTLCGGGSGGGESSNPDDNVDGTSDICRCSFSFSTVIQLDNGLGGWQVAGVTNLHMNIVDLQTKELVPITLPTMYFGLPVIRQNGEFYSSASAADIAADAVQKAESDVMSRYHSLGGAVDVAGMNNYFRQRINYYMQQKAGSATLTPGNGIIILNFNAAKYGWIGTLGCFC
jgi:hypothetical protein